MPLYCTSLASVTVRELLDADVGTVAPAPGRSTRVVAVRSTISQLPARPLMLMVSPTR